MRRHVCRRNLMPHNLNLEFQFAPAENGLPDPIGFKVGARGAHSSRTLMLADLCVVIAAAASTATHEQYIEAVVEANCLGKTTASNRRLSAQRLSELYILDPTVALFRVFRRLWDLDIGAHGLLALLLALARDPLLRATAPPVIGLAAGEELQRDTIRTALQRVAGDRFNADVLDKVVRNTASSWAQSGHLTGRTFKRRCLVQPTVHGATFALYLAYLAGFRGPGLFASGWFRVLDCLPARARDLAFEAKRAGLLDLRIAADVVDLNLERLDPQPRRRRSDVAI